MQNLPGRASLPLMLEVGDDLIEVGTVQIDLDVREVRYEDGRLLAVLDAHVKD